MLWRELENRAKFMNQLQYSCSLVVTQRNRCAEFRRSVGESGGVPIVFRDESAEFLFASDRPTGLQRESFIQHTVVPALTGPSFVVMFDPSPHDVTGLSGTRAQLRRGGHTNPSLAGSEIAAYPLHGTLRECG